jgi:hypothetical protein
VTCPSPTRISLHPTGLAATLQLLNVAELRIPGDRGDAITISVPERDHRDPRLEGWLDAEVAIKLGVWSGRYSAQFHEDDFLRFAEMLEQLQATLKGQAIMSSLDGYLDLTLTGDGLGHISVVGAAWDRPRVGSHLVVSYETDQTAVPQLRDALASLAAYISRTR